MVKDRLAEFKLKAGLKRKEKDSAEASAGDMEVAQTSERTEFLTISEQWEDIETFLESAKHVKTKLDEMEACLNQVGNIYRTLLSKPGVDNALNDQRAAREQRFKELCTEINGVATRITSEVGRASKQKDANFRIKQNQSMAINRRLRDLCASFANEQNHYREKSQERIYAYLRIAGVHMSPNEVEEALEVGNFFNTVAVMTADRERRALFEDVRNRHEDIIKLEASIRELHEVFQDVFMLVESQGEMMNHIEHNVSTAVEHAQKALFSVNYAKKAKRRNIKLKICLAICVVFAIVLLFVFGVGVFCAYLPFICH